MKEFSLLMSLYEKENPKWFKECLDSILNSTTLPSQIVLVKDGILTSELNEIIDTYKKKFPNDFLLVQLPTNVGLGAALREGVKHCDKELIARMDTDDIVEEKRFELQVKAFEQNGEIDILGSCAQLIDENNVRGGLKIVPVEHDQIIKLLWCCPIIHPSVMYKKSVIIKAGSYSRILKRRQDFDLWVNCAINGATFYNLNLPLIQYRLTSDTYKKNSLSVSWAQAKIGIKCARYFNAGLFAYCGVIYPLIKSLLPSPLAIMLAKLLAKVDPRNRV
jgi:glycosyltransferase involved in cell wall biosynthesis